jgi:glutathione reductase (NADPH)
MNLEKAGVEIVGSRAVIEDEHTVRLLKTGARIRARYILVAVGAHPTLEPVIPGGELGITSNEVFHLESLPERILIVGGGYIAVEFAGIFAGLGSRVTLLHRGDKLLRGFDEDLRDALGEAYAGRGINLALGKTVHRLDKTRDGIAATLSDGSTLTVDQVLVATGRRPNTDGLGLERAGITVDEVGAIPVDAYSQTLIPSVYAIGDVTNRANLTPIAIREGHAFADTVFGSRPTMVDHDLIPTAVFSTPEIGVIGCSEAVARSIYGDDRRLQDRLPAHAGDPLGGCRPGPDEAHRRQGHGQGRGRSHHGARRGRDDPARRGSPSPWEPPRPISTAPSRSTPRRRRSW